MDAPNAALTPAVCATLRISVALAKGSALTERDRSAPTAGAAGSVCRGRSCPGRRLSDPRARSGAAVAGRRRRRGMVVTAAHERHHGSSADDRTGRANRRDVSERRPRAANGTSGRHSTGRTERVRRPMARAGRCRRSSTRGKEVGRGAHQPRRPAPRARARGSRGPPRQCPGTSAAQPRSARRPSSACHYSESRGRNREPPRRRSPQRTAQGPLAFACLITRGQTGVADRSRASPVQCPCPPRMLRRALLPRSP